MKQINLIADAYPVFVTHEEHLAKVLEVRRILGEPVLLERLKQQVKNTLTTTKKVTA